MIMLTINQIIKIAEEGVSVRQTRKIPEEKLKGEYDPAAKEAIIYLSAIRSGRDRDITLLHELIHARDDVQGKRRFRNSNQEYLVEKEAIATYYQRKEVLDFAKDFYRVRNFEKRK